MQEWGDILCKRIRIYMTLLLELNDKRKKKKKMKKRKKRK